MQPFFSNLLRNWRNRERGAKLFLIRMAVPAAPFALFVSSRMGLKTIIRSAHGLGGCSASRSYRQRPNTEGPAYSVRRSAGPERTL
jgi:hypothetical protein